MNELKVPHEFEFPFTPYNIQLDFMHQLYETIENGKIGIFESPTGTGKSKKISVLFMHGGETLYLKFFGRNLGVYCKSFL